MTAAAVSIYDALVSHGVDESKARAAAEFAAEAQRKTDARLQDARRAAEQHAEGKIAESEKALRAEMDASVEQIRQGTVSREEYARRDRELATRADVGELRGESKAETAEVRAETKAEFVQLRSETKAEFAEVRAEMREGFAEMREGFAEMRAELKAQGERLARLEGIVKIGVYLMGANFFALFVLILQRVLV